MVEVEERTGEMKFCRYSSVQTTGIGKEFYKIEYTSGRKNCRRRKKRLRRRTFVGEIPVKFEASLERVRGGGRHSGDRICNELHPQLHPSPVSTPHTNFIQLPAKIRTV
jgi:hypothetical protein